MWNMTTYKCKLKKSRLERETYLSHTENHVLRVGTKRVGRVSGNKQLFYAL